LFGTITKNIVKNTSRTIDKNPKEDSIGQVTNISGSFYRWFWIY